MATLTAEMDLKIAKFQSAVARLDARLSRFAKTSKRSGARAGREMGKDFGRMLKSTLLSGLAAVGLAVGAVALGQLIGRQITEGIGEAMSQESMELGLGSLLGDIGDGKDLFQELRSDALRTGASIEGMGASMRKFLASDMDPESALKLNRAILDIAGGVGMTADESKMLGNALAQVKSKGVASMEELRQQIGERGVPVFAALAESIGASVPELIKLISQGKITADQVLDVFTNLEGGFAKFRGSASRMAEGTGAGLIGLIKQEYVDLQREFNKPVLAELVPVFRDVREYLAGSKGDARDLGQRLADAIGNARAMMQELDRGEIVELLGARMKAAFFDAVGALSGGLGDALSAMSEAGALDGLKAQLLSVAEEFGEAMLGELGKLANRFSDLGFAGLIPGMMSQAETDAYLREQLNLSDEAFGGGGAGSGLAESLKSLESASKKRALEEMEKTEGLEHEITLRIGRNRKEADDRKAERDAEIASNQSSGGGGGGSGGSEGGVFSGAGGLAQAIAKVSGQGTILLQREANTIAKRTDANIAKIAAAVGGDGLKVRPPAAPRGPVAMNGNGQQLRFTV